MKGSVGKGNESGVGQRAKQRNSAENGAKQPEPAQNTTLSPFAKGVSSPKTSGYVCGLCGFSNESVIQESICPQCGNKSLISKKNVADAVHEFVKLSKKESVCTEHYQNCEDCNKSNCAIRQPAYPALAPEIKKAVEEKVR